MKKIIYLFFSFLIFNTALTAQTLVTENVENRVAVLEEFTGVNCVWCPEGHLIADALKKADPENVVVINVHAGGYAVPGPGQPDFRTPYGDAIATEMGVQGYPSGTVNRHSFNGMYALGRGSWEVSSGDIKKVVTPVNLGIQSDFDESTRELSITVELYYTDDSPANINFINVAFLENGYIGYQSGGSANYEHNKILRDLITGQWGDPTNETTKGSRVIRNYTYIVPAEYDIDKCDIVGYVTESRKEVYTGREISANGGTTLISGLLTEASNQRYVSAEPQDVISLSNNLKNQLSENEEFELSVELDGPSDWSAEILVNGAPSNAISVASGETENIEFSLKTGNEAGIGAFTLLAQSKNQPNSDPLKYTVNVISGVSDLVLSNLASVEYEQNYLDGLSTTGNNGYYGTTPSVMKGFVENDALQGVKNIYYNVGWTFPSLTDETVAILSSLLDNGVNLMIAGQDIGWDTYNAQGNGTDLTAAFYKDYMNTQYVSDGAPSNSRITSNNDAIFGDIETTNFIDVYGDNALYPEELNPLNGALPILNYNGGNKIGAIRYTNGNYKLVYLGFSFEQLEDQNVANQIAKTTHDWFYSTSSVDYVEHSLNNMIYPNPAENQFTIDLTDLASESMTFNLYDLDGKRVLSKIVAVGERLLTINTTSLQSGMYVSELVGNSSNYRGKGKVSIAK